VELKESVMHHERLREVIARSKAIAAQDERLAEREQRQRDMGIGYLVYAARKQARKWQADFARLVGVTPSTLCRWEHGERIPTLKSLQRVGQEAGWELMVGYWDPESKDTKVLGIVDNDLPIGELELLVDPYFTDPLTIAPWRRRMGLT
jgi:transcriptional regulator with XRE-family HTH domain